MSESYFKNSRYVKELSASDFQSGDKSWLLKDKSCAIVLFYAPWCPHCKAVKDVYEEFAKNVGFMKVYAYNSESNPSHISTIRSDRPGLISGYPTIHFYKNGEPTVVFDGERSYAKLLDAAMKQCSGK